ncbi:hypothetical protein CDO73_15335 [Saccharibacillus sp. O23]|nr:hypothetical protein CDO73_15335 [Saccharibacillus sp. O23]
MTAEAGETLTVLEEESGWLRGKRENGEIGWIPCEHTE